MRELRNILTTRGTGFLSAGTVLALCGILLGHRDLTRIGLLLLVLLAVSTMLGRRHGLQLDVERSASPARVSVDEPATVSLTVRNLEKVRSPVVLAEEQLDYALGDRPRFVIPAMDPQERRTMQYAVRAHTRGVHRLGPLGVRVKDPFGLTTRAAAVGELDSLLVLPEVHELSAGRALGRGAGADGNIPHRVALHGEDDQAIREYRDGDDLRRIHWPATARTGDLMVRQEDRPARRRAVILLDSRAAAHAGTGRANSLEWAVSMCASAAGHLTSQGYDVHLLTADAGDPSGARRDTTLDDMLDTLARIVAGDDSGFEQALRAASADSLHGGAVLAVTGALTDETAHALAVLRQPGSPGLGLVLDRHAFSRSKENRAAGSPDPGMTTAALTAAGWAATSVRPSMSAAEAWSIVTGSASMVGVP